MFLSNQDIHVLLILRLQNYHIPLKQPCKTRPLNGKFGKKGMLLRLYSKNIVTLWYINNEEINSFKIGENRHSGLELELHFMPKFFHENGCGDMPPHVHEFYQIVWFRRGKGTHRIDFVDYPVADNTIFFISPGQIHAFDGNEDHSGVIVLFNASFLVDEGQVKAYF